jgi:hypothetical protein
MHAQAGDQMLLSAVASLTNEAATDLDMGEVWSLGRSSPPGQAERVPSSAASLILSRALMLTLVAVGVITWL